EVRLAADLARGVDEDEPLTLRWLNANLESLVVLLEDEHVLLARGAKPMPPDLVRTYRRVGPDVEEGRVVGGPGRAVVNALDDVPQVLAGVEVPEAELVQLRSVDVGRIGEEIFVRAPLDVAELEVVVAFRELVGVENDLLGGVHRPTAPAVDLVVEAFHRPGVGQPTLEQGRRGGVRLLDPPDDLAVQTFLQVAEACRDGGGIGIFGLELGDNIRVVLVTTPVVLVDSSV